MQSLRALASHTRCQWWLLIAAIVAPATLLAQAPPRLAIDENGNVQMPAQQVPISEFVSPEGKAYLIQHLLGLRDPAVMAPKNGVPGLIAPYLERQRALFPVKFEDTQIGGVHAYVYEPLAGVAAGNEDKVLINLHGGGFSGCWPTCAELESLPIAVLGGIRVVSLDYRQAPQYHFPAASEDVAAAYQALLQRYRPQNIGIYGCSAGGMLTAMSMAWFQQHDLPRPGAIAILCAGAAPTSAAFGGDASYFTLPLGEGRTFVPTNINGGPISASYMNGVALDDPLVAPTSNPAILARFPPTMIVSGTRSYDLSNAAYTHIQLSKAGVETEFYVWEGMFHGFFYNPDVPESRECFDFIVKFFNKWLGRA